MKIDVMLNLIQHLTLLPFWKAVRSRIKYGMTNLFDNGTKAFTLIELLVVVLIIGILAAVAMPKYQVAVEKTRTMNLFSLLKSLQKAQQTYELANGEYTQDPEALVISYPVGSTVDGAQITLPNQQRIFLKSDQFLAATSYVQLQVPYRGGQCSCWALSNAISRQVCATLGKATGYSSSCSLLGGKSCSGYTISL